LLLFVFRGFEVSGGWIEEVGFLLCSLVWSWVFCRWIAFIFCLRGEMEEERRWGGEGRGDVWMMDERGGKRKEELERAVRVNKGVGCVGSVEVISDGSI
jgi:hypothetical protein